jgi:hypothetical protein
VVEHRFAEGTYLMLKHEIGRRPVVCASSQIIWMVTASDIDNVLVAVLERDERFIPVEEHTVKLPKALRDKENGLYLAAEAAPPPRQRT